MIDRPRIDPADELTCLGHGEDPTAYAGAMSPPIVQTSLFAHRSTDDLTAGLGAEHRSHVYTLGQNPTVEAVETKIAKLEHGEACKVLGSGMAAISGVFLGLLESGDHILFVNNTYGPTLQLAERLRSFGVQHDVVLSADLDRIEAAMKPETRMVWMESPGTMLFRVVDIRGICELARERGALTAIDNSWATPLFQKPLDLGVDLVVHAATKYMGGHSDVIAGAIIGSAERLETIFYNSYLLLGGAIGPFDAWLVNRGLRTLPNRMRQHHKDGLEVAHFLAEQPKVRQVFHPGLAGDPALVGSQLSGFSSLFSFELDTDSYEEVAAFVDRLQLFRIGVSWGGVESLALTPNQNTNSAALAAEQIPPGTVRLSVGLEGAAALINDLDQALSHQ
jgi:cystathionine beta-lyase/cystathionine gamma-synthase